MPSSSAAVPDASPIIERFPLGPQWPTIDPFLFMAHHNDRYPSGRDDLGPAASLEGRSIGEDFSGKDGWSMYHGQTVPGFPQHPHRGFETITYVRHGLIDHSDSLGATARFGRGDTQWMTAGRGIVHCEMFPLVNRDEANHVELFQLWLNLPAARKLAEPYFTMLWSPATPVVSTSDPNGRSTDVTIIAGALAGAEPQTPPPDSWAAQADADVAVWHIRMDPGATWQLPAATGATTQRMLYVFEGDHVELGRHRLDGGNGALVDAQSDMQLVAGDEGVECLVLQGRPIGEPVAQYGPFVMNDRAGIEQTLRDYQETGFGGWPWDRPDPTHPGQSDRFAIHPDGRTETPAAASS